MESHHRLPKFGTGEEGMGNVIDYAAFGCPALCTGVGLFAFCPTASADEGLGGFGHLTAPAEQATSLAYKTHCVFLARLAVAF